MTALTFDEKKDRMNNLRQAHFYLGFDKSEQNKSNYQDNYIQSEREQKKSSKINPEVERFEQYRKNPRQSHYELGSDDQNNLYSSVAQISYQDQQQMEKAQLSETTKKDLSNHHFVLGFHSVNQPSEYKREFLVKVDGGLSQAENKNHLKKNNHDFGDNNLYYTTSYDVYHNAPQNNNSLNHAIDKDQLQKQVEQIKQSNIKIGDAKPNYLTQNNVYFVEKQLLDEKSKQRELTKFIKESHTVLGNNSNDGLQSINSSTFQGKQPQDKLIMNNQQMIKEFRASHFDLSIQKEPLPQTTQRSHFASTGESAIRNPIIHKTQSKNQIMDNYKTVYVNGIGQGYKNSKISEQKQIKSAQLCLGSDQIDESHYKSETAKQYVSHKNQANLVNPQISLNIKGNHYEFGQDVQDYYTSNSQYNSVGHRTSLADEQLKELKIHHIKLGDAKQQFQLHSKEIGSKQGPANKLDQTIIQNLKQHHFQEYGTNSYKTSYQAQTQIN